VDRPETRLIGVNPSWRPSPTQTMQVVVIINWIAGRAGNPQAHSQTDRLTVDRAGYFARILRESLAIP